MNKLSKFGIVGIPIIATLVTLGWRHSPTEVKTEEIPAKPANSIPHVSNIKKTEEAAKPVQMPSIPQKIARIVQLSHKVILNKSEREEYHRLLASEKTMEHAFSILGDTTPGVDTEERTFQRMRSIETISAAMSWTENPILEKVQSQIASFLQQDLIENSKDPNARAYLGGDAIELYILLLSKNPTLARDIRSSSTGSMEKLFRYAEGQYERNIHHN